MTNEIEKKFFDTLGVEAKYKCTKDGNCYFQECSKCDWYIHTYPQITDRVLLELICIIGSIYICAQDRETLKEHILVQCMNTQMYSRDIKHQVRTLFEEEKWIL